MFTYIRHLGEALDGAIVNGAVNIPPKDVIADLGFFKTVRKEGGKQTKNSPGKGHGQAQRQVLWLVLGQVLEEAQEEAVQ
jgi:hypothetical protein